MAPGPGTSPVRPRLATDIARELRLEFPRVAAGRIIAVVVKVMADLRRVTVTSDIVGSLQDYRRVVTETARHQLRRI